MHVHALAWIVLAGIILTMIVVDIVGHVRTPHEPTLKEATWWSVAYSAIALIFGVIVWAVWGPQYGQEYLGGYITEKALSIDNLFVFVIILSSFRVPRKDQQEVLLAGIVILLSVLILLTLWGLLSRQSEKPPEVIAPESVSEAASEPVNENVTLTPDLVGRDYDAEVRNNRSYIDEYLFYVTLEYSDTVEKGRIIRQSPEAGEVIQKGDTVSLVVSRGPQMMEMPDIIGQTQDSAVQELATKGLNATCFTVVNDGSEAAGCVVSASEDAGSMVEVGTTIVLYIAGDVPADAPAGSEAPSDTGTPAGGDAAQGGVEYDTD